MAQNIPEDINRMIEAGEYGKARKALKEEAEKPGAPWERSRDLLFQAERLRRIPIDFRLGKEEVFKQIRKSAPQATMKDVERWTESGCLESRLIDGERRYYSRAVGNLFRLNEEAAAMKKSKTTGKEEPDSDKKEKPDESFPIKDMKLLARKALDARKESDDPYVLPVRYRIDYTLTVKPDEVPAGEVVRCWLPFPQNVPTQRDIVLIKTDPERHILAPDGYEQRSVYLEKVAEAGEPTRFQMTFEYTAWSFVQDIDPDKIQPYDKDGEIYRTYAAERPPHLEFTPEIIARGREICGDETNPYLKAKKIFEWVEGNIPWSGAIEYSLVHSLSQRALRRMTGDCGMQGLLFIALCRSQGIPARWQSGWQLKPGRKNLHDWTQIYVEPYGWLYCDPSNGLMSDEEEDVKWFNFGNFDRYRLIVNTNYGKNFYPLKTHFRSEPVDFQRGEVEWRGGNLYFNQWRYGMDVEYIPAEEEKP